MQQQGATVVQLDQNVLAAAGELADAGALQPLGEVGRERPAKIGPAQLGLHDLPAGHAQRQAAADGLDFGKLGHSLTPSFRGRPTGGTRNP